MSSKRKKFYAVSVGQNPGIYNTWEECSAQVTGFPGAKFKGFAIHEQAQQYMDAARPAPSGDGQRPKAALKRKRDDPTESGAGTEGAENDSGVSGVRGARSAKPRQTKLITSPFFSSPTESSSIPDDAREKKRICTVPTREKLPKDSGKSTSLVRFFAENNLQAKRWVDKDWIVANWK